MKQARRVYCLLWMLSAFNSPAQQNWLWSAGGNGNDEALDNCTDIYGNVYTTGYFSLPAKFGNTSLNSYGSGDIFISKQDPSGDYLWTVKAGGADSDRGYGIAADDSGNVYVTGIFSQTAVFGNTTLTSYDGTQDVFVAKINPVGNFIWVQQFGGEDVDLSSSIAASPDGNAVITGRFRGKAQFGSFAFTSENNPVTGLPTFDIFIVRLDPDGTVLWAKQGAAKFEDSGLGTGIDQTGNIYVTGQFSDTLTFSSSYNNNSYNSGFIMKLGSSGNEIWFRQILASQLTIYSTRCVKSAIYLTGDFHGQLIITGDTNTYVNAPYPNKIFPAKMDTAGAVVWSAADGSWNPVSSLDIAADTSGNAYITGNFSCVFSEYSLPYGNGIFNSVGFSDVFLVKYDTSGTRVWERQFGSPKNEYASAISILSENNPLIAGSFETNFNVPEGGNFAFNQTNFDSSAFGPAQNSGYCNDPNYSQYISVYSNGFKDVYSAKPVDLTRQPYDFFDRELSPCLRDTLLPFINNNEDTIIACDSALLFVNLRTGKDGVIGPEYYYHWSNDSLNPTTYVNTSGLYYVDISYKDGCRAFSDSVYVIIEITPPTPDIAATSGTLEDAIPIYSCLTKLLVYSPNFPYLYCTNIPPGYDFFWSTPGGAIYNDSVLADNGGVYTFTIQTPDGLCSRSSCMEVLIYVPVAPGQCLPDVFIPEIHFLDSLADITDTVKVCPGDFFDLILADSAAWAQNNSLFLPVFADWTISGGFQEYYYVSYPTTFWYHRQSYQAWSSGNCSITVSVRHPFTGQPFASATRNFYLYVYPLPPLNPQWSGPPFYCPGDTVMLTIQGGANIQCSGPGIAEMSPGQDTLWVTQPGTYTASCSVFDSLTGCSDSTRIFFELSTSPDPLVTMVPSDGLICPGDSVKLVADSGSAYQWYGPLGSVIDSSQIIYVDVPGFYHYDFTDVYGCSLISEFKELKEYSTPSLSVNPGTVICEPGDSIAIVVETLDTTQVQWLPPLSGNSTLLMIDTPGVYYCSIVSCGITTVDSVVITLSTLKAEITPPGPDTICPGDTLNLSANPWMIGYSWEPGNINTSSLTVATAGTYTVEVKDMNGCTSKDSIAIDTFPLPAAPLVQDTLICAGDNATLYASGSGIITWFDSVSQDDTIFMGDNFITPALDTTTLYYLTNSDVHCSSAPVPVTVNVNQTSLVPEISGDSMVCPEDTLFLYGSDMAGIVYHWTGPQGFSSALKDISVFPFDSDKSGFYFLQVSDSMCTSPPDSFFVGAFPSLSVQVAADVQTICRGDTAILYSLQYWPAYYWLPAEIADSSIVVTEPGDYALVASDQNGCMDTSQVLNISLFPLTPVPLVNDTTICNDSAVTLNAIASGTVFWYNNTLQILDSGYSYVVSMNGNTSAEFLINQRDGNGCFSEYDTATIDVYPLLPPPVFVSNSPVCEGDSLFFYADSVENATYWWQGPGFFSGTSYNLIGIAEASHSGAYFLHRYFHGCDNGIDSLNVNVVENPVFELGNDTAICAGDDLVLTAATGYDFYLWSDGSQTNSLIVSTPGIFTVTVTNYPACSHTTDIVIDTISCYPVFPNIFTPNGDGANDHFYVSYSFDENMYTAIYNRWGELVREIQGNNLTWDGKNQNGRDEPAGVYYFVVQYTDYLNRKVEYKGYVELLR